MQTITPLELKKRFEQVKGVAIVTVVMNTEVKLLKKDRDTKEPCPYVGIRKRTRCNVLVGTDYEKGVNRIREKEGETPDFKAQEHAWADRTDKPTISQKGDQFYLNMRVKETYETEYLDGNENPVDKELLKPFLPKKSKIKSQGTEQELPWRMPKIYPESSIEEYKANGETVKVQS